MKRREFLLGTAASAAGASWSSLATGAGVSPVKPATRPDIILLTCHDIGQHIGCYGVDTVQTPNLDRLAAEGVRFSNLYSTSGVCSPARGALLTGRYPQSNGLMGLTHAPWWWSLNDDEKAIAAYLQDAGYETFQIGFDHVRPHDLESLGYEHELSPHRRADETAAATANLVMGRGDGDRPFFAKVGFTEVHRAFHHGQDREKGVFVPPYLEPSEQVTDDFADFQATIRFFDARVGEILDAVSQSPRRDNTLVVMTSDHGIPYPGAKWTVRRPGITVPLILYQPGTPLTGGKVFDHVMSHVDVAPTLLDLVGLPIPARMQGVSFREVLTEKPAAQPRDAAFAQFTPAMKRDNESRAVVTDRYHLIRYFDAGRTVSYPIDVNPQRFAAHVEREPTSSTRPFHQLYDVRKDPWELEDVGRQPENAGIVRDLSARLIKWMRDVDDPLLQGPVRKPYYERSMKDFLETADQ